MERYGDYALSLITAPTVNPVTLAQAKKQLEIDDTITDDDTYISLLIAAATKKAENFCGRRWITQTWDIYYDYFPDSYNWRIPFGPVQSITSITYNDTSNASTTLATTVYGVDTKSFAPRIYLKQGQSFPSTYEEPNAVVIRVVVGYGADYTYVPSQAHHAIKMIVHELYEERKSSSEIDLKVVPTSVESLLTDLKAIWF